MGYQTNGAWAFVSKVVLFQPFHLGELPNFWKAESIFKGRLRNHKGNHKGPCVLCNIGMLGFCLGDSK